MKPTWTDHSDDIGFVFQSKRTGATVYFAYEAGFDPEGGQYTVICAHGRLVNTNIKQMAKWVAGNPEDLCPACKSHDFTERSLTPEEDRS